MLNNNILDTLSDTEKECALKVLKELAENKTDTYNELLYTDWEELPVDIKTFLHDPCYLGKGLTDEEGRFTLFPYWEDLLCKIFPDPMKPAVYNTLALTGSIGIGKSTMMVITGCYELYRMLCLRDPYIYYGIQPIDLITFALINITLDAAQGVAWSKMQNLIQSSEWFLGKGTINKSSQTPEWKPKKGIELIYGSKPSHIIGRALFWCGQDEVSFRQNMDVEKQKAAAAELVNSASMRMQSRFMKGDHNPTILVLASSKRTDQSFLETWIENKKKMDSKTTYVVDEPQWVIRTDKNSSKKFHVAVGNKFLASEVLPIDISDIELNVYRNRGFRILDVPMGYYENFLDDVDQSLTDIAGISTTNLTSYIAGERLSACKFEGDNPFTKDIITVGNALDDEDQYYNYFDLTCIPEGMKNKPLFMHLDMSLSGDKTGIAGVWIKGKKPPKEGQPESKDLMFQLAFCVSVKAPKGYQVSFEKTRNFIYWLKQNGFKIKCITMDTYQSAEMLQALTAKGMNAEVLSVDRVDKAAGSAPVCKPYQYLKSTIYEQRLLIPKGRTSLLTEELVGLKRDNNSGKVDHTPDGINSKDSADAVCGATWTASQMAEEYAHYYGEDLENVAKLNEVYSELGQTKMFEDAILNSHNPNFGQYVDQASIDQANVYSGVMVW